MSPDPRSGNRNIALRGNSVLSAGHPPISEQNNKNKETGHGRFLPLRCVQFTAQACDLLLAAGAGQLAEVFERFGHVRDFDAPAAPVAVAFDQ